MKVSTNRGGALLGAVLVMILALAGAAQAAGPKEEKKAIQSFAAGRYDEALESYAKLYADTLNPVYLRNIGRCHQKLKQPEKAIESFQDYLQKGKNISADEKAEINGYIKDMEALRDEQARQATPAGPGPVAPVQPIPAAPGPSAPPPGYTAQPAAPYPAPPPAYPAGPDQQPSGTLVSQPQQPPASEPVYTKWWFWTIIGAVVVGGVVTAVVLSGGTTKPPCPADAVACGP